MGTVGGAASCFAAFVGGAAVVFEGGPVTPDDAATVIARSGASGAQGHRGRRRGRPVRHRERPARADDRRRGTAGPVAAAGCRSGRRCRSAYRPDDGAFASCLRDEQARGGEALCPADATSDDLLTPLPFERVSRRSVSIFRRGQEPRDHWAELVGGGDQPQVPVVVHVQGRVRQPALDPSRSGSYTTCLTSSGCWRIRPPYSVGAMALAYAGSR
jgi:hypothetical protein